MTKRERRRRWREGEMERRGRNGFFNVGRKEGRGDIQGHSRGLGKHPQDKRNVRLENGAWQIRLSKFSHCRGKNGRRHSGETGFGGPQRKRACRRRSLSGAPEIRARHHQDEKIRLLLSGGGRPYTLRQ